MEPAVNNVLNQRRLLCAEAALRRKLKDLFGEVRCRWDSAFFPDMKKTALIHDTVFEVRFDMK